MLSFADTHRGALLLSLCLGIVAVAGAADAYFRIAPVVRKQLAVTDHLRRWKIAYSSLKPTEEEWREVFREAEAMRDLLLLYRALDVESAGLESSADFLAVEKIERLDVNGTDIGAVAIRIATAGKSGVVVTAADFGRLLIGIRALTSRKDIRVGGILIGSAGERHVPMATLIGCEIVLRVSEDR